MSRNISVPRQVIVTLEGCFVCQEPSSTCSILQEQTSHYRSCGKLRKPSSSLQRRWKHFRIKVWILRLSLRKRLDEDGKYRNLSDLFPALLSIVSRFLRRHPRTMFTVHQIVSYARDKEHYYCARIPNNPQPFGYENLTTAQDSHHVTKVTDTSSSLRLSHIAFTFLDTSSTNS